MQAIPRNLAGVLAQFYVIYDILRRNSLHIMAVAVDTFSDSDVLRPAG